jgi:hypothetical protein
MRYEFNGRKVHRPIFQILIICGIIVLLVPTLPFHIVKWLFDGRGYLVPTDRRWDYQPGQWCLVWLVFWIAVVIVISLV